MEKEYIECCVTCKYCTYDSKKHILICKNGNSEVFDLETDTYDYCGEWEERQ